MEKRTLLAVVLSVGLIFVWMFVVQPMMFPPPKPVVVETAPVTNKQEQNSQPAALKPVESLLKAVENENAVERTVTVQTSTYDVTFSTKGAVATSIKLLKHQEHGAPIEMVNNQGGPGSAFEMGFGKAGGPIINENFSYLQLDSNTHEFSRVFQGLDGVPFTLKKTFSFRPNEYVIDLKISLLSSNNAFPQLGADSSYNLSFGPQMGPKYKKIDNANEFRRFHRLLGDNREDMAINTEWEGSLKWFAMVGKYFTVAMIPDSLTYKFLPVSTKLADNHEISKLMVIRPPMKSSQNEDKFRFYIGPKQQNELVKFNEQATNEFQFSGLKLDKLIDFNFLGWFEDILKGIMWLFHQAIPNWGVSIVLLTILIKILTWPLTHKSFEATAAMQKLQPKIKEIQEKYKSDPDRMNKAMMEIYQKEKVNPLSGCLPMILQLPIFFALYSMFSNHFDLRGANFIPGWIPDLSVPESVFNFGNFYVPIVNWNDLRLLPILMVVSQIIMSVWTQPQSIATTQGKIMTFALPIVFFFMLYDMPSGLMVYWTLTNVLSALQQAYINNHLKRKKA